MAKLGTKPNGIYYLDVRVPGEGGTLKRQRISCETRDRSEAEAQRREWLAGLHPKHPSRGGVVAPKGRAPVGGGSTSEKPWSRGPTLVEWLEKCLIDPNVWGNKQAVKNHKSSVRVLGRLIPSDLLLTDVSFSDLKELRDALQRVYKPGSVKKLFGYVTKALRYAVEEDELAALPKLPKIEGSSPPRTRVVTLDEEKMLFACIRERLEAEPLRAWWHFERLLVLLLDTGCRLGELLTSGPSNLHRRRYRDLTGQWVERSCLKLFDWQVKGEEGKKKGRQVALTGRALKAILELNERQIAGRWFPWPKGSSGPIYMLGNLRADMKERGFPIDDVVLHSMRHTCLSRLADSGMALDEIKSWAGHTDIKITADTYVHSDTRHLRGADVLEGLVGSGPSQDDIQSEDGGQPTIRELAGCGTTRADPGTPLLH